MRRWRFSAADASDRLSLIAGKAGIALARPRNPPCLYPGIRIPEEEAPSIGIVAAEVPYSLRAATVQMKERTPVRESDAEIALAAIQRVAAFSLQESVPWRSVPVSTKLEAVTMTLPAK
jgi:hypothetical protein